MRIFDRYRVVAVVVALALGALAASYQPAGAVPVTRTFTFSASDGTPIGTASPAPVDPVTGSFTLTFDPAGPIVANESLVISGFSLSVGPILVTVNSGQAGRFLIGGASSGIGSLVQGANDFFMQVSHAGSASPQVDAFSYTHTGDADGVCFANTRTITFADSESTGAVSAPETVAILGLGLVAVAFARRRRTARRA